MEPDLRVVRFSDGEAEWNAHRQQCDFDPLDPTQHQQIRMIY